MEEGKNSGKRFRFYGLIQNILHRMFSWLSSFSYSRTNKYCGVVGGGPHSTMDSNFASHPAALGSILGVPKNFSLDVAEIY